MKAICTHSIVYTRVRAKERDGRKEMGGMSLPSERKGGGGIGKRREKHKKMGTLRLTTEHSLTELIKDEKTISS